MSYTYCATIINKTIALSSVTRPLLGVMHEHFNLSKGAQDYASLGIVLAVLGMTIDFISAYVLTKYRESWIQLSGMLPR